MIGQWGSGGATDYIPEPPADAAMTADDRTFWGEVAKFKQKASEAMALWARLREKRAAAVTDPKLQAEYETVMAEAEGITGKIAEIERVANGALATIGEKVTEWFGLGAYRHLAHQAGQLGFVQVAAIALVTAAIAWISSWIGKGYIVDRKLDAVEKLVAEGVSPTDAGKLIAEKGAPGFLGSMFAGTGTLALVGVGAVLLYFLAQQRESER